MTIGKKIKYLRTLHNMSQKELADRLYLTRQAVTNYERDANKPDTGVLLEICKLFDVSLEWILDESLDESKINKYSEKQISLDEEPSLVDEPNSKIEKIQKRQFKIKKPFIILGSLFIAALTYLIAGLINNSIYLNNKYSVIGFFISEDDNFNSVYDIIRADIPYKIYYQGEIRKKYISEQGVTILDNEYLNTLNIYSVSVTRSDKYKSERLKPVLFLADELYVRSVSVNTEYMNEEIQFRERFTSVNVIGYDSYGKSICKKKYEIKADGVYEDDIFYSALDNYKGVILYDEHVMYYEAISDDGTVIATTKESSVTKYNKYLYLSNGDYKNDNLYLFVKIFIS